MPETEQKERLEPLVGTEIMTLGPRGFASTEPQVTFTFASNDNKPVLTIHPDGRIWWQDHFVDGDDEFKLAMLDLLEFFRKHN